MAHQVAFRIKHDSDFYAKYFAAQDERKKFKNLARPFLQKYGLNECRFCLSKSLIVEMTRELREKYKDQLYKNPIQKTFYSFKKKSPLLLEWHETVTAHIDFTRLELLEYWWLSYIMCGRYALWDRGGEIYGCLESNDHVEIKLDDFMEPIKYSEYYAVIEKYEGGTPG